MFIVVFSQEVEEVTIALVICGSRTEEALVMMKSAIIFKSSLPLKFIILAEFHLQEGLHSKVCISWLLVGLLCGYPCSINLCILVGKYEKIDE